MEKKEILENIRIKTEEVAFMLWDGPYANRKAMLKEIDEALQAGWKTEHPKDLQLALAQGLMNAANILIRMANGEE